MRDRNTDQKIAKSHNVLARLIVYAIQRKLILFPLIFGLMTNIVFPAAASITVTGGSLTPSAANPGDTEKGLLYMDISVTKNTATFTGVTINRTGTGTDADIASVEVWRDDGDNTWEGTGQDTQIGSGTFSGGSVTISGLSEALTTTAVRFYVVFDIAATLSSPTATGGASVLNGGITASKTVTAFTAISSGDISLPVELGSWTATSTTGSVELVWMTESEVENQGFIIERIADGDAFYTEIASFVSHPELLGQGSTTQRSFYSFTDYNVNVGETYTYRLADVDYVSNITYHDDVNVTVRDEADTQLPETMSLNDAYPNPFNPLVNLGFKLENSTELELNIYDVRGSLIQTITQGFYNSGNYTFQWDGMSTQGEFVSSGVYLLRLTSGSDQQIQRITLLR